MPAFTDELIRQQGLTADEYDRIVAKLGREPNLTEMGIIGVMWSEHCSYKSSKIHLKTLPSEGKHLLVGPGENAGIVDIGNGWAAAFKIESHNHPSFVEPFQGATTGVGGILRDIFTMGARPVAVMDSLRFGSLDDAETGARTKHIVKGVVEGIGHYGNCFGVPTVGGECVFDPSYAGNPLVNAYALGVFRSDEIFFGSAKGIGNPVIYVGAKTGRDGIKGATMASEQFDEESEGKRPNVQVGDPFLEKLLLEACLEAMKTGAILGIQDMGAAGLTCSTCEMGDRGGVGIKIDLADVPQRETGMTPYEIMLSESQERMLLVAERGREQEVFDVFTKWGLDAVEIGTVTEEGILQVDDHGDPAAVLPNPLLTDDAPLYNRPHTTPYRPFPLDGPELPEFTAAALAAALPTLLASPDLCSKRWIYEQYDYTVRTNTTAGPGGDAAVIRIKEAGVSLGMALDGNGRYCALDPREGAKLAVAECCRNLATVGAEPIGTTNCLNFGNPEKPDIMAQLVEAIGGIGEACVHFESPITGGNVSLYNETLDQPILPTPVMGVVGLIPGMDAPVGTHFPVPGLRVVLFGGLLPGGENDIARRFGATQFARTVIGKTWGLPPALDMAYERAVHGAVRKAVRGGLLDAVHDVSDGGLAVALAECCFGPERIGARVALAGSPLAVQALYHEAPSRVIAAVRTENLAAIQALAAAGGVELIEIGETQPERLDITYNGDAFVGAATSELFGSWDSALEEALEQG